MRHVLAAIVLLALFPHMAAAAVSLTILPLDASALGDFASHDLRVNTTNDWTTAAMVVQLIGGQVYHDLGGSDPPTAAQRDASTALKFDTSFGILDDGSTTDVIGPAGDLGGGPTEKQTDSDGIDVAWFNTDSTDTGTNVIGRATFTDDAVGIWRIGVTEALESVAFFSGMVFNGVMTDLLPGDGNNDGLATGADLISVQQGFGDVDLILPAAPPGEAPRPPTGHLRGDTNDNGQVTGQDLIAAQQNFGNTLAAPVAIPEPTAALGLVLLLGLTRLRVNARGFLPLIHANKKR